MSASTDTIVALASANGQAGVGVVRLSGENSLLITQAVTGKPCERDRHAHMRSFFDPDGQVLDSGLVLPFFAPASYTGETVVEWQTHGAPIVLDQLIATAIHHGARFARPGEFTERAFLNGKLDLTQAEAVADLIAASNLASARGAMQSLSGAFSERIEAFEQELIALRVFVEATIDFPDEDVEFLETAQVKARIHAVLNELVELRAITNQGVLLRDGIRVVIAGPPNAGKSSLLNALSGSDTAIVTNIPGTTRDVIRENVQFNGLPLTLLDTAGLRDTDDPVEKIGTARAEEAIKTADVILWVEDDSLNNSIERPVSIAQATQPVIHIRNKTDLSHGENGIRSGTTGITQQLGLSIRTGAGFEALRKVLVDRAGYVPNETQFVARRRHLVALDHAEAQIQNALSLLDDVPDTVLVAEELRIAHDYLGEITGKFTTEDLLGAIFSSFCIGK